MGGGRNRQAIKADGDLILIRELTGWEREPGALKDAGATPPFPKPCCISPFSGETAHKKK